MQVYRKFHRKSTVTCGEKKRMYPEMAELDIERVGSRIRIIRKEHLRMTQAELATALGLKRPETVSDWERGEYSPAPEKLEQIADMVGAEVTGLFGSNYRNLRKPPQLPPPATLGVEDGVAWIRDTLAVIETIDAPESEVRDAQKQLLRMHINEFKSRGLPVGPLYELLGRVEAGDGLEDAVLPPDEFDRIFDRLKGGT